MFLKTLPLKVKLYAYLVGLHSMDSGNKRGVVYTHASFIGSICARKRTRPLLRPAAFQADQLAPICRMTIAIAEHVEKVVRMLGH